MNQITDLLNQPTSNIGLFSTLLNFLLCIGMGFALRAFYIRRSYSLTGKNHIGAILPVLAAIVFLVITVVKSSLALSLGLVGALSIVRFRTPIKEPEELVYLFIAIGLGLGFGAGQTAVTTLIVTLTMVIVYFFLSNRSQNDILEYNMVLGWSSGPVGMQKLIEIISPFSSSLKLVRLERGDSSNTAVLMLTPHSHADLDRIYDELTAECNEITISFYESQNA